MFSLPTSALPTKLSHLISSINHKHFKPAIKNWHCVKKNSSKMTQGNTRDEKWSCSKESLSFVNCENKLKWFPIIAIMGFDRWYLRVQRSSSAVSWCKNCLFCECCCFVVIVGNEVKMQWVELSCVNEFEWQNFLDSVCRDMKFERIPLLIKSQNMALNFLDCENHAKIFLKAKIALKNFKMQ